MFFVPGFLMIFVFFFFLMDTANLERMTSIISIDTTRSEAITIRSIKGHLGGGSSI